MAAQNEKNENELSALKDVMPPVFSGVEQSEEMLRWIWENFSAVAGDQPSFECWRMLLLFPISFFLSTSSTFPLSSFLCCEIDTDKQKQHNNPGPSTKCFSRDGECL